MNSSSRRIRTDEPRILLGLREVAGYLSGLKGGFETLGVHADVLDLNGHPFAYAEHKGPWWIRGIARIGSSCGKYFFSNLLLRLLWLGVFQNVLGLVAFCFAIFRYDVFIFTSNSTFFFYLDLPLLKLLNKTVIFAFLGSEVRPVYLSGYAMEGLRHKPIRRALVLTRLQRWVIRRIERYADYILSTPAQGHFQTRPFLNFYILGVPVVLQAADEEDSLQRPPGPVRIAHAPSKRGPKGSAVFEATIAALRQKGRQIE